MIYSKSSLLWGFLLASLGGILLHFIHHYCANNITALFSPVNESLWEHVKIILFPYIIAAIFLTWGRPTAIRPWLLVAILITLGMLLLGWIYHIQLGGSSMWVDIGLYFLAMAVGFWLPTLFSGPFHSKLWWIVGFLTLLLVFLVFYWSFFPPNHLLFQSLATRETFFQLPYPL